MKKQNILKQIKLTRETLKLLDFFQKEIENKESYEILRKKIDEIMYLLIEIEL